MHDADDNLDLGEEAYVLKPSPARMDACVQAHHALSAVPSAMLPQLLVHLAQPVVKPRTWTLHMQDAGARSAPARYLETLSPMIAGAEGERLPIFLEWLFVRTQALSLTWVATEAQNQDPVYDHGGCYRRGRECSGLTSYLPGTLPQVRGRGANRKTLCPFHRECTPSMVFSLTSNQWHCHGCGITHTHCSMVAECLGLGAREAADMLRRHARAPQPPWQLPTPRRNRALALWGWTL
jgi:hypothetical protein